MTYAQDTASLFKALGVEADLHSKATSALEVHTPIDGSLLGRVAVEHAGRRRRRAGRGRTSSSWPGATCRRRAAANWCARSANRCAPHKADLGRLISLETGKILQEGLGEVQEVIDICEFAVGLSRQLYGLTIASERPDHKLLETWHPLGVVGVISAFNFPMAVFAWNAALALVCGNTLAWKPSEKTPLSALALNGLLQRAARRQRIRRRPQRGPDRRPRDRRGAGGPPQREAGERDRLHRDGQERGHRLRARSSSARCWNSAATTPPSSAPRPTWNWWCAARPSPPPEPPASAAPACAG